MARHAICALVVLAVISSSVTSSYFKGKKKYKVHMPKTIRHDQCEIIVRSDCLHKSLPRGKRICVEPSDELLLQKLKDIGGYNPNYVAMTPEEAAKFKDPRLFETKQVSSKSIPIKIEVPSCNTRRRRPCRYRRRPYWRRRHTTRQPWVKTTKRPCYNRKRPNQPQDEAFYDSIDIPERRSNREKVLGREKRSNHDDDSLSCWERGSLVQETNPTGSQMITTTRRHLCGECQRTTHLPSNMIPRFINEALCKSHESISSDLIDTDDQCADHLKSVGVCKQRVLVFPALELAGDFHYDDILSSSEDKPLFVRGATEVQQNISSGCQCQVEDTPNQH